VRRFLALALVVCLLSSGIAGCSQPVDTGSTIPPQSQPIVALLALVGLGIGLTAYHHHNEHRGGGPAPSIVPAVNVLQPFVPNYLPSDLAIDVPNATVGVLETNGTQPAKFLEISLSTGVAVQVGLFTLTAGFAPTAISIDPSAHAWFVSNNGDVVECDIGNSFATGTCSSSITAFRDTLPAGQRSIVVDSNFIFIIEDGGSGKVNWYFQALAGGSPASGSYNSASTSSLFTRDAIESTSTGAGGSDFTAYHQDGRSESITIPSANTISQSPSFTFAPTPLGAPSDNFLSGGLYTLYAFTGNPTGTYQITRYQSPSPTGLGSQLTAASINIAVNGSMGGGPVFGLPLSNLHYDGSELVLWSLDPAGAIVYFAAF
jgi:hypothetical protein